MNEATFWSARLRPLLVAACREAGERYTFERVENLVGNGTPDVDYCVGSAEGKIELKYATRDPVSPTARVLGRDNGLRRSQIIWATRRLVAGGRVLMAIGSPSSTWLLNLASYTPSQMRDIEVYGSRQLDRECVWSSNSERGAVVATLKCPHPVYPVGRINRKVLI